MKKKERGLFELLGQDPEKLANELTPASKKGTKTYFLSSRRHFILGLGAGTLSTLIGRKVPFGQFFPHGLVPVCYAQTQTPCKCECEAYSVECLSVQCGSSGCLFCFIYSACTIPWALLDYHVQEIVNNCAVYFFMSEK